MCFGVISGFKCFFHSHICLILYSCFFFVFLMHSFCNNPNVTPIFMQMSIKEIQQNIKNSFFIKIHHCPKFINYIIFSLFLANFTYFTYFWQAWKKRKKERDEKKNQAKKKWVWMEWKNQENNFKLKWDRKRNTHHKRMIDIKK